MTVMFLLMPTVRGSIIWGTLTLNSAVTLPMGALCIGWEDEELKVQLLMCN